MKSRRIKISFSTINDGKYTVIKQADIAQTNQRIKTEMKSVVRVFEKKEAESKQKAALLVLNA